MNGNNENQIGAPADHLTPFDSAAADAQGIDPLLTQSLDDTSPLDPLLPKADYEVEVVSVKQARNSKDNGNIVKVELKTLADAVAVTGENIPAGRRLFPNFPLTPTPKWTNADIQRQLKRFQMWCGATGAFFPLERYVGCKGPVSVGFSKVSDDYPDPKNEVKAFKLPGKS